MGDKLVNNQCLLPPTLFHTIANINSTSTLSQFETQLQLALPLDLYYNTVLKWIQNPIDNPAPSLIRRQKQTTVAAAKPTTTRKDVSSNLDQPHIGSTKGTESDASLDVNETLRTTTDDSERNAAALSSQPVSSNTDVIWDFDESDPESSPFMVDDNGLLYVNHRLYIPDGALRTQVLTTRHDVPLAGHFGNRKTLELISRDFWWPGIRADVKDFVKSCHICSQAKPLRQKPAGLLQP
jgi:hypothetical protein